MGILRRGINYGRSLMWRTIDAGQRVERRLNPTVDVPPGGFEEAVTFWEGSVGERKIALTFDDGPHPVHTPQILDALAERGIKATFFVIGANAAAHPDLVKRAVDEGHEIGNHTWSHRQLTRYVTTNQTRRELRSTHDVVMDITGRPPVGVRPPYGVVTPSCKDWAGHEFGYPTVMWSVDSKDWEQPDPERVIDRVMAGAHAGSVVLMHDVHPQTVEAAPVIFDRLLEEGYTFETLSPFMATPESNDS